MTDLTSEQKAQVAELLGWERCGNHKEQHWRQGAKEPWERVWRTIDQVVTLEALLAYCREREWDVIHEMRLDQGGRYDHTVRVCHPTWGLELCVIGFAYERDELTALSLAVLAAAEQEEFVATIDRAADDAAAWDESVAAAEQEKGND